MLMAILAVSSTSVKRPPAGVAAVQQWTAFRGSADYINGIHIYVD